MSEKQWTWFEEQLKAEPRPEVTIVGSGIQVLGGAALVVATARGSRRIRARRLRGIGVVSNASREASSVQHDRASQGERDFHLWRCPSRSDIRRAVGMSPAVQDDRRDVERLDDTPFRITKPWPFNLILNAITPSHFRKWILPSHGSVDGHQLRRGGEHHAGAVVVRIKGPGARLGLEESMLLSEFDETEPAYDRNQEGCNAILDMTPNMRAFTIVRFFAWLLSVYLARTPTCLRVGVGVPRIDSTTRAAREEG